jgi:hypothetical protein
MIIVVLKWTLQKIVVIGKDKMKCGKVESSTHIRRRWRSVLTKLPRVISQARKVATPFEAWNYLITDAIRDDIVHHTNQYIIQPNFSSASDAKLTDETKIKAFIGLLCLAGGLRNKKVLKDCGVLMETELKNFAK